MNKRIPGKPGMPDKPGGEEPEGMEIKYTIPLSEIVNEFSFEKIYLPEDYENIKIVTPEVNRPGLALTGFFGAFEEQRLQLIGNAENKYLKSLTDADRTRAIRRFMHKRPAAVLFTSNLEVYEAMIDAAKDENVPVLRTKEKTSPIMSSLIASLNTHLAPRVTQHGVLVEVYGEGMLLLGDSGVGKSETAIELVKRGHRLIADDVVDIKRVSAKTLVGTAPEIIRHYVELRGIGIIDVRRIFGMGAVKQSERIDLVIKLEQWQDGKMYDRLGLDDQTENILGLEIPAITIPVKPGRNLAIILEIAAMNNRQKKMGYNTAEEFNKKLLSQMGLGTDTL